MRDSERHSLDRTPLQLSLIAILMMSASIAVLILVYRSPLAQPHWSAVAKAFALLGATVLVWQYFAERSVALLQPHYALALLGVMVLDLLTVLLVRSEVGALLLYPLLLAAWLFGGRSLLEGLRRASALRITLACFTGVALGVIYFFVMNTMGYAHLFVPEAALLGTAHHDTLYHSAVASMLTKFGAISAGLDGPVPHIYHAMSHLWLGGLASWLEVPTIHVYYIGPQVVGAPLLIFALAVATFSLWQPSQAKSPLLLVLLPVALLFVVDAWDWYAYLDSESYLFSLSLFLLTLPLVFELANRKSASVSILSAVTAVLACALTVATKVSVGTILAAALAFAIARPLLDQLSLRMLAALGVALTIIALGILLLTGYGKAILQLIEPWQFVHFYPDVAYANLAVTLAALGLAALLYFWSDRSRQRILETVLVLLVASVVPAMLLFYPAGAQYYFLNVGTWLGIVLFAGAVLLPLVERLDRPWVAVPVVLLVGVVALAATPKKAGSVRSFHRLIATLNAQAAKGKLSDETESGQAEGELLSERTAHREPSSFEQLNSLATNLESTFGGRLKRTLDGANLSAATSVLVFVPPSLMEFWTLNQVCFADSFLIPALFGVPMLNGLPPLQAGCGPLTDYGFDAYSPASHSTELTDEQICAKSVKLGFEEVLIVASADSRRRLRCGVASDAILP
jgi:hypothetical protein